MKVTIVGAGNMGRAIGTLAVKGGHDVEIVDRDPADAASLAEELGERATVLIPEGTPVVKAFNTNFASTLVRGEVAGQQLDVLIAGDDETAKQKVSQLVSDGGLRPIDAGPLARAEQLEQLGFLHIVIQEPLGLGFGSAFKLHP